MRVYLFCPVDKEVLLHYQVSVRRIEFVRQMAPDRVPLSVVRDVTEVRRCDGGRPFALLPGEELVVLERSLWVARINGNSFVVKQCVYVCVCVCRHQTSHLQPVTRLVLWSVLLVLIVVSCNGR